MNVEDSYEGAVRRLRRLGHAGVDLAPPRQESQDRVRDLEELATLACDENERLTRELDVAHAEVARLQRQVSMLQETLTNAQSDEEFSAPARSGRGPLFYMFLIALVGGGGVLYVQRPWERMLRAHAVAAVADVPAAPAPVAPPPVVTAPVVTAPVVTAPVVTAPAPTTKPSVPAVAVPKVEPTMPKVAAMIPKAAPAPAARAKHHRAAPKHHAAKGHKHSGDKSDKPAVGDTDDPLGGVNL